MMYFIEPCSKPRMTQGDKWKKRPVVLRYYAFKEQCRLNRVVVPESGATVTFYISMPKSWTKKKKKEMKGEAHQQKPDIDNLIKALLDAVYDDDSCVWDIRARKVWSDQGMIIIEELS